LLFGVVVAIWVEILCEAHQYVRRLPDRCSRRTRSANTPASGQPQPELTSPAKPP
jgi:hypothetical protein